MNKHYTNADFLNRIYGAADDAEALDIDGHLEQCEECRLQWARLSDSRQKLLGQDTDVSGDFLAAQRQRIQARMEHGSRPSMLVRWSPALAVAGMALCVILWKTPIQRPVTQPVEVGTTSDAQLMADIYQTVYDSEPDVVEPLHGLFESKQKSTQQ